MGPIFETRFIYISRKPHTQIVTAPSSRGILHYDAVK